MQRFTIRDAVILAAENRQPPATFATAYAEGLGLLSQSDGRYRLTPAGRRFAAKLARRTPRRAFS